MFVTLVRKPAPDIGPSMTSVYHCDTVHLQSSIDKEDFLILDMAGGEGATVEISKAADQVYILNNEGKTIDSYRWNQ